jgi:hypothetical protein
MTKYEIESMLDKLLALHGKRIRADINAAACQTSYDHRKAYDIEGAYCELYDATVESLTKAFADTSYQQNVTHFLQTR